ncbi:accessory colonization factor AcfC [Vibrio cholerae]|nr:major antigenic peptide PEB3 [Vibrio cholerae]GIB65406.1 accessory colonization factor AcfC [Vibrio cholerae]
MKSKNRFLLISLLSFSTSVFADVNLYGPGGPHVPLIKVAESFEKSQSKRVNVTFGPQATWNDKAKKNADILFGASEHSALAIAEGHSERFSKFNIHPVFMREAIILVKKGNPKNIKGMADLLKPGIGIVVNDGAGVSNTSGTAVWEDSVGRMKNVEKLQAFRSNIHVFAPNSGSARKAFVEGEDIDAWITWVDWAIANPTIGDMVRMEDEYRVYRDFNVVLAKNPSSEAIDFFDYLTKSKDAEAIFQQYGWFK